MLHFIVNPVAGSGRSSAAFVQIRSLLDNSHVEYSYAVSTAPMHAMELAREAQSSGKSAVIAVGGDGTAREVASALVHTDCTFGLIPAGTGNDLARALQIPADVNAALDIILCGNTVNMDVGSVNDEYFFNVSGIGFDVDVLVKTEQYKQKYNGMLPYFLGIVKAMAKRKTIAAKIICDGKEITMDALLIDIANGTHYGGGMKIAPNASVIDGYFDVCLIKKVGLLHFLCLLPGFFSGKHVNKKPVSVIRGKEIIVETSEPFVMQMDGEVKNSTPAHYRMLEGALKVFSPLTMSVSEFIGEENYVNETQV